MSKIKYGLDVDGVLSNFVQAIIERAGEIGLGNHFPPSWRDVNKWIFSERFKDVWDSIENQEEFWLNIKPFEGVQDTIPGTPDLYLTARPIPNVITEAWLFRHGFPSAPTVTVCKPEEKLTVLKERGINVFVDDLIPTVQMLRDAGIDAYLYAAPYQIETNHSHLPKIASLTQLGEIIRNLETPSTHFLTTDRPLRDELSDWLNRNRHKINTEHRKVMSMGLDKV